MKKEIDWSQVRRVIGRARYCSIASIEEDGSPRVTPIGSVYLSSDGTGFFLEKFTSGLPHNIDRGSPICLMAVDVRPRFWLSALVSGRFKSPPAIRLKGTAGPRREASAAERQYFLHKVSKLRWTRGYKKLWSDFAYARDLEFNTQVPVLLGGM